MKRKILFILGTMAILYWILYMNTPKIVSPCAGECRITSAKGAIVHQVMATAPKPTTVTPEPIKEEHSEPETVRSSWYGVKEYCERFNPACIMANGEKLEDTMYIAACDNRWKLGTKLKLSHGDKSVIVSCADRGNFAKYGRMLDLSKAAFEALAPLSRGVIEVTVY